MENFTGRSTKNKFPGTAMTIGPHDQKIRSRLFAITQQGRARISGRMSNHERVVGSDWVVTLQDQSFVVEIAADRQGATWRERIRIR